MMIATIFLAAMLAVEETELEAKVSAVVERCAAHYKALDAVAQLLPAKCKLLDYTHDLVEHPVKLADGKLTLENTDDNSAAFFVEFDGGFWRQTPKSWLTNFNIAMTPK